MDTVSVSYEETLKANYLLNQTSGFVEERVPDTLEESTPNPILYPELLTQIFSYLPLRDRGRAAQVCKYWRETSLEKCIWRGVEAKLHLKSSSTQLYQCLTRRGITQIQVLSLKRSLRDLVTNLSAITTLKLSGCYNVTDSTLNSAFSVPLPHLKVLDLSLCKQITDISLGRIAANAPNLITLELGGCCQISDRGLFLIAWGLRRVRTLNIRSCHLVTDTGIGFLSGIVNQSHLMEPRLNDFLAKFDLLKGELLTGTRAVISAQLDVPHNPKPIPYPVKRARMSQCAICHQDLSSPPSTSHALQGKRKAASKRSPKLILGTPGELQKIGLSTKFGTPDLQALNLQDCQKLTDSSLLHIAVLPHLTTLNLSFSLHISDTGLSHLSRVPNLTDLNLRSCENISDGGLANLCQVGPRLRTLDISFCDKVGNTGMGHVSQMSNLRTLSLSACDISDQGLVRIANSLTHLVTLNLGQCSKISDESLKVVSEKCTLIEYIDLYGCGGISRAGLNLILQMPNMKSLNLGLWHLR